MKVTRKIIRFESNEEFIRYDKGIDINAYYLSRIIRYSDGSIKAEYTVKQNEMAAGLDGTFSN